MGGDLEIVALSDSDWYGGLRHFQRGVLSSGQEVGVVPYFAGRQVVVKMAELRNVGQLGTGRDGGHDGHLIYARKLGYFVGYREAVGELVDDALLGPSLRDEAVVRARPLFDPAIFHHGASGAVLAQYHGCGDVLR